MTHHPDAPSGQPYSPPPWDPNRLPPPSPPVLKAPREWEQIKGIRVADPDGWRSFSGLGPKDFGEPLTEEEFDRRVATSTVDHRPAPGGDGGGAKKRRKWPWIIGGVFLLIVIVGVAAGNSADPTPKVALPSASQAPYPSLPPEQKAANASASNAPKAPPAPTATAAPKPKPKPAPVLTAAQENAIGTAKDYLESGHFSRSGLINQLEFEEYSKADATFAVDHIAVNWNEQAVGTARDYLETGHFSRGGLINQLEFEGYTRAQATYAVGKVGL